MKNTIITTLTDDQKKQISIDVFHMIFGHWFKPECEEANRLDRELMDNPQFVKDMLEAVDRLPGCYGEIIIRRLCRESYAKISAVLGSSYRTVKRAEAVAWRKLRHPFSSKRIIHYVKKHRALLDDEEAV